MNRKRTRILLCAAAAVLVLIGLTNSDNAKPATGQTPANQPNRVVSAAAPDSAHPAEAELAALDLEVGGIGVRAARGENAKQGGAQ